MASPVWGAISAAHRVYDAVSELMRRRYRTRRNPWQRSGDQAKYTHAGLVLESGFAHSDQQGGDHVDTGVPRDGGVQAKKLAGSAQSAAELLK